MNACSIILAIGRTLIPRYFRSIFEGGVTELQINLKHLKESYHNTTITLDCDQSSIISYHGKPSYKVRLLDNPPFEMEANAKIFF